MLNVQAIFVRGVIFSHWTDACLVRPLAWAAAAHVGEPG